MEVLITILARKGSKGLPGKNVKRLHGKPLIQWTIDQAESWAVERGGAVIVVSSDDPAVRKIAFANNLFYVQRPPELATDDAGKVAAIRHAWWTIERRLERSFDLVIDLDVCNPMRRLQDIEAVYHMMASMKPLTVFSVTKARRSPYFNMWPPVLGMSVTRRQDGPKMYDLNCCIYAYSNEFMLSGRQHAITEQSMVYEMPAWSFCDIDTELDFEIVEFLMEKYAEELGQAPY